MLRSRYRLLVGCWIVLIAVAGMSSAVMAQEADFTPHLIGIVPFEVGYSVWVEGNFAYVTGNDGVEIIDIRDPYGPVWIGRVEFVDGAYDVVVQADIAYIGLDDAGFVIANVSNPTQPELLYEYPELGTVVCVLVDGDYAYVGALGSVGGDLRVFNVSDLTTTVLCGQLDAVTGGRLGTMAVKEGYLFMADSSNGVQIVNITTPVAPEVVGEVPQTYAAYDVMIHSDLLFVGCHYRGIRVFDVSIPYLPQLRGEFSDNLADEGEALGVWGEENYLYVADNYNVELLNISLLSSITELGEYDPIVAAHDLTVQDQFVYVASGDGLTILAFGGTHPIRPPTFLIYLIPVIIAIIAVTAGLVYRFHRGRDNSSTT
jgi:hypothetical protein